MNDDFFDRLDFNYPEIGTVLEDTTNGIAKIYINIISINIAGGNPFRTDNPKKSSSNILNKDARSMVSGYTVSNYIKMKIPKYIIETYGYPNNLVPKGSELLIVFVGGDITKPRIIGRNM